MTGSATVFVVDDDERIRALVERLLRAEGLRCECFESAEHFLDRYRGEAGCLLLDVRMPQMSGPDLQAELARRDLELPIIFVSGHADVPTAVHAMRSGALDVLEKPFELALLLERIGTAIEADASRRAERARSAALQSRLERLTPREREVFNEVVRGRSNKGIAFALDLSPRTVEKHKERALRKMECDSPAELIRLATRFGLA